MISLCALCVKYVGGRKKRCAALTEFLGKAGDCFAFSDDKAFFSKLKYAEKWYQSEHIRKGFLDQE